MSGKKIIQGLKEAIAYSRERGMTPEDLANVLSRPDVQLGIDLIVADTRAQARNEALEEAAKCAEAWPTNRAGHIWREEIAAAIRALKG